MEVKTTNKPEAKYTNKKNITIILKATEKKTPTENKIKKKNGRNHKNEADKKIQV